jgi:tripartite-type tricarboxylate transporter receptor subunit TctC
MNKLRLLLVAALCAGAAQAQEARPARSVKFIVPSSPGETPA